MSAPSIFQGFTFTNDIGGAGLSRLITAPAAHGRPARSQAHSGLFATTGARVSSIAAAQNCDSASDTKRNREIIAEIIAKNGGDRNSTPAPTTPTPHTPPASHALVDHADAQRLDLSDHGSDSDEWETLWVAPRAVVKKAHHGWKARLHNGLDNSPNSPFLFKQAAARGSAELVPDQLASSRDSGIESASCSDNEPEACPSTSAATTPARHGPGRKGAVPVLLLRTRPSLQSWGFTKRTSATTVIKARVTVASEPSSPVEAVSAGLQPLMFMSCTPIDRSDCTSSSGKSDDDSSSDEEDSFRFADEGPVWTCGICGTENAGVEMIFKTHACNACYSARPARPTRTPWRTRDGGDCPNWGLPARSFNRRRASVAVVAQRWNLREDDAAEIMHNVQLANMNTPGF